MNAATLPVVDDPPPADQRVVLYRIDWRTYVELADARGESANPRMTYCDGVLELMSPGPPHERVKSTIGRLVELFAFLRNIDLSALGSTTWRDETKKLGLEADECYFAGAERPGVPDIAIEVIQTSGSLSKLRVYAGLGVPEVWVWRAGRLRVFALRGAEYEEIPRSAFLPTLDLLTLSAMLLHPSQSEATRLWARFVEAQALGE